MVLRLVQYPSLLLKFVKIKGIKTKVKKLLKIEGVKINVEKKTRQNKSLLFLLCSCREKKDTEVQTLEVSKDAETESIDNLEKENDELREKLSKLKNHYVKLFDFAKKNNIELKPRNVPMGSLDSA